MVAFRDWPFVSRSSLCFCPISPPRPGAFHIFVEPVDSLGENIQQSLSCSITVGLERQRYVAYRRPVTLERHVEALRLNRERAGVVVCFAVHQQDWILDLIGVPERRHLSVEVR